MLPPWGAGDTPGGVSRWLCRRGDDGAAILAISDQKDVALEIHVTNEPSEPAEPQRDGDDAHEALLSASFPYSFRNLKEIFAINYL